MSVEEIKTEDQLRTWIVSPYHLCNKTPKSCLLGVDKRDSAFVALSGEWSR